MGIKRALVCAPRMPEFDRESGARRIFHLIEFLREAGWAVSFLARNATDGEKYAKILRQGGIETYAGAESMFCGAEYLPNLQDLVAVKRFDLAIFAFWYIAEEYAPIVRTLSPDTRIVVDSIDLHFLRAARGILVRAGEEENSGKLDINYASEMMRELNAYAAADAVLTVSQKEADLVNDFIAKPSLAHAMPDCEDWELSTVPFSERKGVLFIGNFRHPPNHEAAEFLCKQILPKLNPSFLFDHPVYIVGNDPDEKVLGYVQGLQGVHMVGWVPSVQPYLESTRVSIIPLLHGAGTKRKLIQALMVGTPSVSTSIGTEGLDLCHDEHVLVANDPETFAKSVERLASDRTLWNRLAKQGRTHTVRLHARESVKARFNTVIESIISKETGPEKSTDVRNRY